jgi:ABC-2 type transport system ATP-binding protein
MLREQGPRRALHGTIMAGTFDDPYLLSISHLTKRYKALTAVDDVSLQIRPGEIFALLGANGAGKTTLIGCVCGLISRFEGDVRVAGFDVRRDYKVTRQLIGLVPQELNYDAFFKTGEALVFQGGYFGRRRVQARADALLDIFRLREKAGANTRSLSGGMKRRLMICKALVHEPVLLFLDEPTAGVDVELREELWTYIQELRMAGTTIVLTTHYLEEAERLADRIGIIHKGKLLRVEAREALMNKYGRRWIEVSLSEEVPPVLLDLLQPLQAKCLGPRRLRIEFPDAAVAGADGGNPIHRLKEAVEALGLRIDEIEGGRSRLEDIFREIVHVDGNAS